MLEPHIACKSVVVVVHQVVLTLYLARLLQLVAVVVETIRQVFKVALVAVVVVLLLEVAHAQHHQCKVLQVELLLVQFKAVVVVVQATETTQTKMAV
jgi:hypothetical protein